MAVKTPIRGEFSGSDLTGFAEFQASDFIGIADGGTGAITASGARTALGIAIGSDVQAYDAQLTDVAGLTPGDGKFIVGDGSNFVTESGNTARASLGLGTSDSPTFATLNLSGSIVAEGATANDYETTLAFTDPTADRTITFPNATGTVALTSDIQSEETIEDFVGDMFSSNTETFITATYDDSDGTLDLVVPVKDEDNMSSDSATHLATQQSIKAYVDSQIQTEESIEDFVGGMVTGNTETLITVTYQDADGTMDFVVDNDLSNYDNSTSGFITATLTQEQVEDFVGGMLDGDETFITVAYDDTDGNIDFTVPVKDEDNMASDSASHLATQQSIKAYVDSQVTAQDLDFQADSGGALSIDLDSETITFTGGTGIDTTGSSNDVSFAIDSTVATLTGSQTLTNKTISGADNTLSNIGNSSLSNSTVSFGGISLALGASDATPAFDLTDATNYPTSSLTGTITNAQLAGSIANAKLANSSITVTDGSNSTATALGGTITFSGTSNEVEVAESSGTITIGLPNDVTIAGDLTVSGTTTTVDSTTVTINDPLVRYADNNSGNSVDFGWYGKYVQSSTTKYAGLVWDASASDKFRLWSGNQAEPTTTVNTSGTGHTTGTLIANIEGNVTGNVTGNADTATALATARTIHGVSFDGSANIDLSEVIQDTVGAMFGSNTETRITVSYEDGDGTIDLVVDNDLANYDNSSSGFITATLTQEQVEDYVGGMFSGNTETLITATYEDSDGTIDLVVDNDLSNYDNSSSGFITATLTQEQVEDYVGGMVDSNTETFITVTYDDSDGTLDFVVPVLDEDNMASNSASHLATQQSIKAYVDGLVQTEETIEDFVGGMFSSNTETFITATYDDSDGTLDLVVPVLDEDNMASDSATHLATQQSIKAYVDGLVQTEESIEDFVGGMVTGNTETFISVTYEDSDGTMDFVVPVKDEDNMSSDSDTHLATQQSIKAYVDSQSANTEEIQDIVGAMVAGNTESNITVTYDDTNGKLDFSVTGGGTVEQAFKTISVSGQDDVVADAAADTLTFAAGSNITLTTNASNDTITIASADTTLTTEAVQDIVGGMFSSNTETGVTVTYEDGDGTIDLVVGTLNQDTTGNAATATALETARTIHGVSFDGTGNIDLTEVIQDTVGAMFTGNTETNITATYEDSDGTIDLVATGNTTEQIQDIVGAMFTSNTETNITATYEDSDGTIDLVADLLTEEAVEDYVNGLIVAGANITKTYDDAAGTLTLAATGGAANAFSTLAVSGQSNVVADAATDTLTLVAGTGMTLTTDASADSITFASSGGGGTMPFTEYDGSTDDIVLSSTATGGSLPVTLSGGTSDPIAMTATTQTLTSYADADNDTKVEVERTTDNDTVHIKAGGTDVITATATGVTITNLTVSGTTTQANELKITDTLFELNADGGSLTTDAGMIVERGSTGDNAALIWDESADAWVAGTTATDGSASSNLTVTEGDFKAKTQNQSDNSTKVATTAYVDTAVGNLSSNSISDADSDTKIQVEEGSDEDIIRADTGGQERVTIDNNVSMSARGGFFTHNATLHASETFTIASTEGTVAAGPLDVQGTVDVQGTLVVV